MAGSLNHIIREDGKFTMDLIENLGDAHEALEECFTIIHALSDGGAKHIINIVCDDNKYPTITRDMKL